MSDFPSEISDWAEHVGTALAEARLATSPVVEQAGMIYAATADVALAYQVLVTLSRTVALVLRPTGHAGGPIGAYAAAGIDPAFRHAAQLVGFAAQGDAGMVDAIARAVLAAPRDPPGRSPHRALGYSRGARHRARDPRYRRTDR